MHKFEITYGHKSFVSSRLEHLQIVAKIVHGFPILMI